MSPHGEFAADLARLLVDLDFNAGTYVRRGIHVVYLKGRQQVAQLLAFAGAQEAALDLEEVAVVKDVRARANRLANWDEANLRRTSAAALRQLEAIAVLEERGSLTALPPGLQEVAELRRRYPYHSLTDLTAERPDLSRSALNHRLRRLVEAAAREG